MVRRIGIIGLGKMGRACASNLMADQAVGRVAWFSLREMVSDGAFMAGNRLMVVGSGSPDGQPHVVGAAELLGEVARARVDGLGRIEGVGDAELLWHGAPVAESFR